jgi:hypothetical protein
VPGIRPTSANFKPEKEIELECLTALAKDKVKAATVIGAGTYRGSRKNKTGAEIIASPNPSEV